MNENWEEKTLDEVCELIKRGIAPKYTEEKGITVINQKCIRDHKINLLQSRLHNSELKKVNEERFIKFGDVLINSTGTGTLGRIAQVRAEVLSSCTVDTHVTIVRPKNELFYMDFFGYALIKIENEIEKAGEGTSGQTELSRTKLQNDFKISYPICKIEQKQIVEILDKAFEAIEKAKTNLEKNLKNTKELFDSKLNEIFSQKGEGWEEKTLGEVCKTGAGGTPLKSKKEYYENGTIPWLCSGEVKQGNIYNSTRLISKKGLDNSSAKLFPINTVVIAMYGATAGDVGILRFETSTNQAVCGILPNDNFLPEFIYYSFLYRKKELIAQATGNAQPNISQIKIKNTLVPIIDKVFQEKIINELEDLKEKTKQLEQKYQQKLDNLEELKKSLLQKAFNGELTN